MPIPPSQSPIPFQGIRKYGDPPFGVAVLHGGPGAPGYMALVARELAATKGILEPIQTRDSLDGQVEELGTQLTVHADLPVTLIGSSWGAVLALLLAAREPKTVGKLILIGCAVFDATSSGRVEARRLERMSAEKRKRYEEITGALASTETAPPTGLVEEWGEIIFDCDVFDPLTRNLEVIEIQFELQKRVWSDFVVLRDRPGFLESEFRKIAAPTVVILGSTIRIRLTESAPSSNDALSRFTSIFCRGAGIIRGSNGVRGRNSLISSSGKSDAFSWAPGTL